MKNFAKIVLGMLPVVALTSCATIVSGSKTMVLLDGEMQDTLTIQTNVRTYDDVILPQLVEVKRKHLNDPILVSDDSKDTVKVYPGQKVGSWFWGNLVFITNVAGMAVDLVTGSMYRPAHDVHLSRNDESKITVEYIHKKQELNHFYRHEISGNLSFASQVSKSRFNDMEKGIHQQLGYNDENKCFDFGATSINYRYFYHISRRWAIGAQFGAMFDNTSFEKQDALGYWMDADLRMDAPFMMVAAKYYWLGKGGLSLYSKGGLGAQRRHLYFSTDHSSPDDRYYDEKKWLPVYQITPVGFEVGGRNVRFFAELGYGTEGVLSFGIAFHFKASH